MEQGIGGYGIQICKGSRLDPLYITIQFPFFFFGLSHCLAVI